MAIPGLGDAITLFDLSVRVTTFINDLRHAQDDFISLRSEADCLRICLGSLTSESCQNALYHYITIKQGQDLKQIVDNTKFNMMDLNNFIAKCAKLGDNSSLAVRKKRDFFKKIGKAIGKGFTRYKFAMTNKQAFRDKLVLPTASINVFLTSLTHVGLVNMGRIMIRTGHGMAIPTGPGGQGTDKNAGVKVMVDSLDGWQAVGKRIAFRDTIVKKSDVTVSFEEELLEYALHLIRGGLPFHVKAGNSGTKHKVTKTTRTKTRSRSRSRGPLGVGKGGSGQMYVMRKKSFSRPSTEKVEIVQREWESESDSDGPRRRILALPAPESSSHKYLEIKPDSASDSEKGSDHTRDSGPGRHRERGDRSPHRERRRRPSSREVPYAEPRREPTTSREEIRSHRRDIRSIIRAEQEDAYAELEQEEQIYRTQRVQRRMSRPVFHSREEEAQYEREEEADDVIAFLAEQYGVVVEPLEVPREPIDNGVVRDIPPPTVAGDVDVISSDSEGDQSPPTPPPSRTRSTRGVRRQTNDTLRAQTYRSSFRTPGYMPYSARYEPYPDPSRFRPGARPYTQPGYYDERPHPHPGYYDERPHPRPDYDDPPSNVIVEESYQTSERLGEHPPGRRSYRRNSDDSDPGTHGLRRPRGSPGPGSGPGPAPYDGDEISLAPSRADEKEFLVFRKKEKERKQSLRPTHGPSSERQRSYNEEIRADDIYSEREREMGRRDKKHRRAMPPPSVVRMSESGSRYGDDDVYMRGARSEDGGSGGSHDGIEIVRK